jgi:hypothetical protein
MIDAMKYLPAVRSTYRNKSETTKIFAYYFFLAGNIYVRVIDLPTIEYHLTADCQGMSYCYSLGLSSGLREEKGKLVTKLLQIIGRRIIGVWGILLIIQNIEQKSSLFTSNYCKKHVTTN